MRSAFAVVLVEVTTASVLFAQVPQRLAFDSTGADTVSCEGLRLQFVDIRADPFAGTGFVVRVRNPSPASHVFDPSHLSARMNNGRTVTFLSGAEVASQYMQSQGNTVDQEERVRMQRDIAADPRYRAGALPPNSAEVRFLALGWRRRVEGDPAQLLPMTLLCGRDPLGQIGLAAADHH
jgi:hypothetical protein